MAGRLRCYSRCRPKLRCKLSAGHFRFKTAPPSAVAPWRGLATTASISSGSHVVVNKTAWIRFVWQKTTVPAFIILSEGQQVMDRIIRNNTVLHAWVLCRCRKLLLRSGMAKQPAFTRGRRQPQDG